MVNYDDLPLFPLHVVLFPDMPLPLHIFEPRYREMMMRCREENSPFGVILIRDGEEAGDVAVPHLVGTTARITQFEEMPDGKMNVLVFGETRFRVTRTSHDKPYLCAEVEPLGEESGDPALVAPAAEAVADLFKEYLRALFAMTGRSLSALQLPRTLPIFPMPSPASCKCRWLRSRASWRLRRRRTAWSSRPSCCGPSLSPRKKCRKHWARAPKPTAA